MKNVLTSFIICVVAVLIIRTGKLYVFFFKIQCFIRMMSSHEISRKWSHQNVVYHNFYIILYNIKFSSGIIKPFIDDGMHFYLSNSHAFFSNSCSLISYCPPKTWLCMPLVTPYELTKKEMQFRYKLNMLNEPFFIFKCLCIDCCSCTQF